MRCEFGLCRRPAEFEVNVAADFVPLAVCGMHVTPVVSWGVVPDVEPTIRHLASMPESAA